MPDQRRHRGPHPEDAELFGHSQLAVLRCATVEYCYLLDRGYAPNSALKLVGDRHQLRERQRIAINRSTCSTDLAQSRRTRQVSLDAGRPLAIDGFNLLTTIEAAMAGGVIITGREGCFRDMASMHGSYRKVEETRPALQCIGQFLAASTIAEVLWLLDEPVSNSGRLASILREIACQHQWPWSVRLSPDPDRELVKMPSHTVITADREILDQCTAWSNTACELVQQKIRDAWIVHLGDAAGG